MGLADRHSGLDLDQSLRPGLDLLANEIVIALKRRTRFPQNAEIYRPGLVRTAPGQTLLDYELGRFEFLHAELGRYTFASQEAFTEVSGVEPIIVREQPPSPIAIMASGAGARVEGVLPRVGGARVRSGQRLQHLRRDGDYRRRGVAVHPRARESRQVRGGVEARGARRPISGGGRRHRGHPGPARAQGPRSAGLRPRAGVSLRTTSSMSSSPSMSSRG